MRVTPAPVFHAPLSEVQLPGLVLDDETSLRAALVFRLRLDREIKHLTEMKTQLNAALGSYVDENGAIDVPSDVPGRVIRLKKVAASRTSVDAEGLWAALPARNRRGLFKTTHTLIEDELEQRIDRDAALKDLVRQHMTTTVNKAAVRVDYVEAEEAGE
jgi:hypothetical protein